MFRVIIVLAGLVWIASLPGRSHEVNYCIPLGLSVAGPPTFPSYERTLVLDTKAETSANVSIGDLNGDGKLDILLVNGRHWQKISRIFLGNGRGHFATAYNLTETAYRSYSGRLVDLDGDGDLDVVLSNDAPDPKVTFLNDGKGHFHLGSTYGRADWETRNANIIDLDGDGRPDIIVANRTDRGANYICLGKEKGSFGADCTAFSEYPATTITPADFNHDGLIDLAVPYRDGGQSFVYLAGPHAAFSNLKRVPFGPPDAHIRMAEAADLTGDGLLDMISIDERRGVGVYYGQKDGTFSGEVTLDQGKVPPYALAVSDLNLDGQIDIIVGNVEAPSTIFFNDGSGRHFTTVHFGDNKGTAYGFAIADLDRNGLPDIAVARSDATSMIYFGGGAPGVRGRVSDVR